MSCIDGVTDFTERALADDLDGPKVRQLDLGSSQPEVLGLCLAVFPDLSVFGVLGVELGEPCLHFDTPGGTRVSDKREGTRGCLPGIAFDGRVNCNLVVRLQFELGRCCSGYSVCAETAGRSVKVDICWGLNVRAAVETVSWDAYSRPLVLWWSPGLW